MAALHDVIHISVVCYTISM